MSVNMAQLSKPHKNHRALWNSEYIKYINNHFFNIFFWSIYPTEQSILRIEIIKRPQQLNEKQKGERSMLIGEKTIIYRMRTQTYISISWLKQKIGESVWVYVEEYEPLFLCFAHMIKISLLLPAKEQGAEWPFGIHAVAAHTAWQ